MVGLAQKCHAHCQFYIILIFMGQSLGGDVLAGGVIDGHHDFSGPLDLDWVHKLVGDCSAIVVDGHAADDDEFVQQDAPCVAGVDPQGPGVLGHFQPQPKSVLAALQDAELQLGLVVVVPDGEVAAPGHVDLVGGVGQGVLEVASHHHVEHVVEILGTGDSVGVLGEDHLALPDEERDAVGDLHVLDAGSAWLVHGAVVEVEPAEGGEVDVPGCLAFFEDGSCHEFVAEQELRVDYIINIIVVVEGEVEEEGLEDVAESFPTHNQ